MASTTTEQVELQHVQAQVLGATSSSGESEFGLRSRPGARARVTNEDDDDDDDFDLMSVEQHFPTQDERKWSLYVALVSAVDVIVSGIILIVALCFAYRAAGVSLWCLSFQALSHLISSVLLAMRFAGEWKLPLPGDEGADGLLRQRRRHFLHREQVLSTTMGLVMLVSCAALLFKAARKLKFWDKWYLDHRSLDEDSAWADEFLAWYGFAMYVIQACFRLAAAMKLRRMILWHGFSSSVVSLLFLFVMGVAASYEKEWSWKAEPIAAIILSLVTLIEAIRIVLMHLDDMNVRMRHDPKA
mmetsp:Transcript_65764/g.140701  ORF Transcript_65764/g.140701 Transcript_65764/m.140701 type:complete len:300 (+) Transcript_65764:68-967(+)